MGEEAKKPEEKKMEDHKPPEESKKSEVGKPEKKAEDDKKEDKKKKKKKEEESKEGTEAPPPPPQEIVLKVYMHCEGCARKVRRSLKGFDGVEEVTTDCKTNKVVVKGEKADPLKVLERVQRKSHGQVELLSPIPKQPPPPPPPSPAKEEKKPEPAEQSNRPEKKEETKVVTVVLKVHMHCDACSQEMKKRILRMKGVESAEPDLKGSQVSVKGVFEPAKLVEYVHKRTGRHAVIVKQEPEEKEEDEAGKDGGDKGKNGDDAGGNKKGDESGGGNKDDGDKDKNGEGNGVGKPETSSVEEEIDNLGLELKKNENLYYPPYYLPRFVPLEPFGNEQLYRHPYQYQYQYQQPAAAYPPQIFSDENPNACSVM